MKSKLAVFHLAVLAILAAAAPPLQAEAGRLVVAQSDEAEIEFWKSVKDSRDPEELKAYVEAYPNGKFVPLARLRLKKLQKRSGSRTAAPVKPPRKTSPSASAAASKTTSTKPNAAVYRALELFGDVLERVRSDYVEKPDDTKLVRAAIRGMLEKYPSEPAAKVSRDLLATKCRQPGKHVIYACLDVFGTVLDRQLQDHPGKSQVLINTGVAAMLNALDPHSTYYSPTRFRQMQVQTRGEFGGLGIEVTMADGLVKVVSPIDDSPAQKAGIQAGDLISRIGDQKILGLTLAQSVERMRGKVGSPVKLMVIRKGVPAPFEVSIVRDVIRIVPVKWKIYDQVGYVRITTINQNAAEAFRKAIKELQSKIGPGLKGFVIDVRNNAGGLLDGVIKISDDLLSHGVIATIKGRTAKDAQITRAIPGEIVERKPIAILINGGSASGIEIFASALQDNKRATLVGTRSFGKGSVQTIIPLGSNGALRLTTGHYYTPAGKSIAGNGIAPDIVVQQDATDESTGKRRSNTYVPKDSTRDTQLLTALRLLNGASLSPSRPSPTGTEASGSRSSTVKDLDKLD